MQTLTWQEYPNKLRNLKQIFPQLWANYKREFHQFFNTNGTMNHHGHRAYDGIKQIRRFRMIKQ